MTSRERVLAALNHQEPDRVPIDFGGHRSSGIAAIAYARLRDHLGFERRPIRVYDIMQQLAVIDDDVLDRFGVDTIEMGRGFLLDDADWKDWTLPDGTPCLIPRYVNLEKRGDDWVIRGDGGEILGEQKKGCLYFEQTHYPLADRKIEEEDFSDLGESFRRTMGAFIPTPGSPGPTEEKELAALADGAMRLREKTDRAILGLFGGNLFEAAQTLYRMDNHLMQMSLQPEATSRFYDALCDSHIKNLETWLGAVGPYIDIVLFGDDLGGQDGPLISPAMYRRLLKPYHSRLWKRAKELADVKVLLHCCGAVRPLLGDLIEAGLDAINPVQISGRNMDAAELKAEFGDNLTFWGGGCDTQTVLPQGNPNEVARHVQNQVEAFNVSGGFVFQQVHNILANVLPENIEAMFDAVRLG